LGSGRCVELVRGPNSVLAMMVGGKKWKRKWKWKKEEKKRKTKRMKT
jgi:hypothetical protein